MTEYCLVESRDPFESGDVAFTYELAVALAQPGNEVVLFLVQNGVLAARREANPNLAITAAAPSVSVLVDDYSLRERGISQADILDTTVPASLETVVDALARGVKTVWR